MLPPNCADYLWLKKSVVKKQFALGDMRRTQMKLNRCDLGKFIGQRAEDCSGDCGACCPLRCFVAATGLDMKNQALGRAYCVDIDAHLFSFTLTGRISPVSERAPGGEKMNRR